MSEIVIPTKEQDRIEELANGSLSVEMRDGAKVVVPALSWRKDSNGWYVAEKLTIGLWTEEANKGA
jgi:hypothetical protein